MQLPSAPVLQPRRTITKKKSRKFVGMIRTHIKHVKTKYHHKLYLKAMHIVGDWAKRSLEEQNMRLAMQELSMTRAIEEAERAYRFDMWLFSGL